MLQQDTVPFRMSKSFKQSNYSMLQQDTDSQNVKTI